MCITGINDTSGKFAAGVVDASINDTGGKFFHHFGRVVDTGGKQWEQLSNCRQLKKSLKKMFLYANSTTQRCPKEIIKKISD
jgi:hypothetical protein